MTRFSDLNDDVLHEIIGWLQLMKEMDPSAAISLPQLALVCSRFGFLVPRHLVKAVNIRITVPGEQKFLLLRRTLKEKPGLRALVRNMQLTLGYGEQIMSWANELLQQLPNLVYLEIQRPIGVTEMWPRFFEFSPEFFRINKLEKLRRVNYERGTVDFGMLLKCMSLSSIERIDCSIENEWTTRSPPLASDATSFIQQPFRVRTLNLNDSTISVNYLFRDLLEQCRYLQHCTGAMPVVHHPLIPRFVLFSAANLELALTPTTDTLVSLDLLNLQSQTRWENTRFDGTQLNLNMFSSLESIKLPAYCFFDSLVPHDSRNGTYARFPFSMTDLNLYFGQDRSILHANDQERSKLRSGDAAFEPWTYAWIMEFAYHKATCFPKLHSLTLEEELTKPDMSLARWTNEDAVKVWSSVGTNCNVLFRQEYMP